jgi:polyphenol oxidase
MSDSTTALLHSSLLLACGTIEHAFGTRTSQISQDQMAQVRQVHSALCLTVDGPGCAGEADALITSEPGLAVSVRTADCFPILLADGRRNVVAAVHAGWRGTAARIVMETIATMRYRFGTNPADIRAAIGPGIGVCCYEVGEEVGRKFGLNGAGHLDLARTNCRQLLEAGVPAAQIDVLDMCTFCDFRFHSWRRDKEAAGRMISYIRVRRRNTTGAELR